MGGWPQLRRQNGPPHGLSPPAELREVGACRGWAGSGALPRRRIAAPLVKGAGPAPRAREAHGLPERPTPRSGGPPQCGEGPASEERRPVGEKKRREEED